MGKILYALVLLVPVAFIAELLHWPMLAVFFLSALGLVPLAGLIGQATEELAHHLGPRWGGLLNATFGNAAELIITLFAVQRGLLTLVKASITGSIIGNLLLILGVSLLAGGLKHGIQRYDSRETSLASAMMILALAGLLLPATFALGVSDHQPIEEISLLVAGVLLLTYIAYLAYSLRQGSGDPQGESHPAHETTTDRSDHAAWSIPRSLATLALATAGAAWASEMLVGTVEPVTQQFGWSEFFVGVIVVAIVGNAAEHFSAVQFAWKNRLDLTLGIAAGSSTQVALFVAPVLVFASVLLGHPMDFIFQPLELAILVISTSIFAYICIDGESNWLEGVQLLAIYLMAGIVFFLIPVQHG